jgi:hypothetical protein
MKTHNKDQYVTLGFLETHSDILFQGGAQTGLSVSMEMRKVDSRHVLTLFQNNDSMFINVICL